MLFLSFKWFKYDKYVFNTFRDLNESSRKSHNKMEELRVSILDWVTVETCGKRLDSKF